MIKSKCLSTVLSVVASVALFLLVFLQSNKLLASHDLLVTLKITQEPLSKVIQKISEQTGYSVMIDEKYFDLIITGEYNTVGVITVLRRIFAAENPFITVEPSSKLITVKTAGHGAMFTKATLSPKVSKEVAQPSSDNLGVYELDNNFLPEKIRNNHHLIDPLTGKSWDEVEKRFNINP